MGHLVISMTLFAGVLCTFLQGATSQWTGELSVYKMAGFQNPDSDTNAKLNHVFRHGPTGSVYVGAVNTIYRLNESLMMQANVSTTSECMDAAEDCFNYNKILFVDSVRDMLMTCGSEATLPNGHCQQRDVDRLTIITRSFVMVSPGKDDTTVSLLAPGPGNRDWLYVASTYVAGTFSAPPVSRRDLDKTIPNNRLLFSGEFSEVNFNRAYRSRTFDINYLYGFASNGYTYFITNQQQDRTSTQTFVSKLIRVCHQSPNFQSYAEIMLTCRKGSTGYNLAQSGYLGPAGPDLAETLGVDSGTQVLFAVFARSEGTSIVPSESSALCVFRMSNVENAFVTAVKNCIQQGSASVPYLEGSRCPNPPVPSFTDYRELLCDTESLIAHAYGPVGVSASPLLQVDNARLTSIITSVDINHTVAFIGTSQGSLYKVHIENATYARHYETLQLGNTPVLTDISLDDRMQEINLLTEQQLLILRVENCNQYTSCETCIGDSGGLDGDPYCGWCTLQNKCTKYDECPVASVSSRWLPYNTAQCIRISDTSPNSLSITDPPKMITLTVQQLPALPDEQSYSCQFNQLQLANGNTSRNMIQCSTPYTADLPVTTYPEDHVTMTLSIYSSESEINFISTEFIFFNCSHHTSCTECVTSNWNCDWCVYDNLCTHRSTECMQGDTIISGNNNPAATHAKGPDFCPQLQPQEGEELVPMGMTREILVNASMLPNATQLTKDYQCSLLVEGTRQTSPATVMSNNVIRCGSRMYTYEADTQELEVNLIVTWNGDRQLDDPSTFKVTLYKCSVDRSDCSQCLSDVTTRPEFDCRWCGSQCAFKDDDVCDSQALDPSDPCPAPALIQVDPTTGPIEGNTVIEITGTNIGRRFQDVRSVMVGQQACDLTGLEDQYVTGRSVRCRTASMGLSDGQLITVSVATVNNADDMSSTGNVVFTYKDPMITTFSPVIGPEAGGTLLTVLGTDLNTGRDIRAVIEPNISCDVNRTSISSTSIECRTSNSSEGYAGLLSVIFDGAVRSSTGFFTFQPNPNVTDINPSKSIESGGRTVNVIGHNFMQIISPEMIINENYNLTAQCTVTDDTHMTCSTPDITMLDAQLAATRRSRRQTQQDLIVGFIMDDVSDLLRWSETQTPEFEFQYVRNPSFRTFPGQDQTLDFDDNKLTIRGDRLTDALTIYEVSVFIGDKECPVQIFDNTILTCEAPVTSPQPVHYDGAFTDTALPAVYVVYTSHRVFIGYIRYINTVWIELLIYIGAAILLGLVILVVLFLWCKLKRSQKEVSAALIQMEQVEKGMAEELRIAFAELQTNVTDLTHDLAGTGMPFVSHRQYAANMLFIGLDIQPETSDPHQPKEETERAMMHFNRLLGNKKFLLAFIQALDDDKKMAVKDKATIASLLTVIMMLENKLQYLTDIMVTLMSRQVQEAVDNNRPKQLFRRTESIVEKLLSNWIALCLYDQLKDRTAFPLFLLYSGIKVQTEKGPVDAITRQAHFSLSEERLLKGNVEFKEMTLHVVVDSEDGEKKEVRVLDMDAIPQVKEKILDSMYRNKPHSDRQRSVYVNLEWRQGKSGRLTLQDIGLPQMECSDSKEQQTWQKLNTLKELGIQDNSLMALVPKQLSRTSINEAISGNAADTELYQEDVDLEGGVTLWHLEKPQEEVEESEKQRKKRLRKLVLGNGVKGQRVTFPRLLTMKGIVQEYVDNMFQAILTVEGTPLAIKYLFDFFDSQATRHGIEDPDIAHIWKSNTLPLRFWVSAITHPNYIFDISPTPAVESSLGVVGQAFYDSCNKSDHQLGWESSFNKLLYNREVGKYRGLVESFYEGIGDMDHVSISNLEQELDKTCKNFTGLFSKLSTLLQLYEFTRGSKDLLMSTLEEDDACVDDNLAYKLEQVEAMLSESTEL